MIDNSSPRREKRDWTLLIFIIPIGILLMYMAGLVAARLVPEWSVIAGMGSNLDPDEIPYQQNSPIQPILPAILTPMSWFETFLTPGANGSTEPLVFMPFVVLEPSAIPQTPVPPTAATQPSATAPSSTPPTASSSPPPATGTSEPPPDGENTPTPPTPTAPTPTAPTPPPTATGTPSTPPPGYSLVDPPPSQVDIHQPPNNDPGTLGGGGISEYMIIDLGSRPVKVSATPDGNYDLIFYEALYAADRVALDHIIIGISTKPDGSYYEVFNWGDSGNIRDQNTNVDYALLPDDPAGCPSDLECDNRNVPITSLHGTTPYQTGILIDVDYNTSGKPPEGNYRYLVILAPASVDSSQIDSIEVKEVSGGKLGVTAVHSAEEVSEASDTPAEEAPVSAQVVEPGQPADLPAEETESEPSPPVEEGTDEPPPEQIPDPPSEASTTSP